MNLTLKGNIVDIQNRSIYKGEITIENGKIKSIKKKDCIENHYILPGFIDAHCHFLGLGLNQLAVDLVGTTSFEEVVQRVTDFQNKKNLNYFLQ